MKKLLFWLLIFAGISTSVPPVRERVAPRVVPVRDYLVREVGPPLRRGLDPVFRWSAVREAGNIARELRLREASLLPVPSPKEFQEFMARQHYTGRDGLDPWGNPYMLILERDSIIVQSTGPDGERNTDDDVRQGVARR